MDAFRTVLDRIDEVLGYELSWAERPPTSPAPAQSGGALVVYFGPLD
jgi:hypothetical protein